MVDDCSKQPTALRIRSDPCELAAVRDRVREAALDAGFGEEDAAKITLAVDEALTNVIRHGYGGPCDEPIEIRVSVPAGDTGAANIGSIASVRIAIRELGPPSNGQYWNGTNLFNQGSAPNNDFVTLHTSSWTYVGIGTAKMEPGTSYYLTVAARDDAVPTNDEGFFSVRSVTFTFDNGAPTVNINVPVDISPPE